MKKPAENIPSDVVFETARTIASDMQGMVENCCEDIADFADLSGRILQALENIKENLEKHAVPMSKRQSKERRAIRAKIKSIDHAMSVAKKIGETLDLTIEDLGQIMSPFGFGKNTSRFLEKIMKDELTNKELKAIEDGIDIEDTDKDDYNDDTPPDPEQLV